ncbi:MAG: Spy/CpxP family protein refolding chaperone [Holophagaceae bacterium]|nr:Spy/CpxP family protein refolding chaperone [Holophagaceae bacterium]
MNMNFKLLIPFGLAAGLLAQAPPPGPPQELPGLLAGRAGMRVGFMAKQLNLSAEQKATMKAIGQKHKDEMKAKHVAQRDARKAFQAVMADPNAKTADIQAAHQVLSQRSLDIALAGHALRAEMRAVLTPEQQAKADQLRADFQAKHQERMMHLRKGLGLEK